jgi:hypothetical protein
LLALIINLYERPQKAIKRDTIPKDEGSPPAVLPLANRIAAELAFSCCSKKRNFLSR